MPTSNNPTTVNCLSRGITPAGVTMPCGAISATLSPVRTPSARASSDPSTMPNSPGLSASSFPARMCRPSSATCASRSGRIPRTTLPRTAWPAASIACALTNGAYPTTCGSCTASFATARQSASWLFAPLTCTCEATPRIRVRSSFWKPFMTESTTISAATPSAMPAIEMAEMKLMKWLRRLARV